MGGSIFALAPALALASVSRSDSQRNRSKREIPDDEVFTVSKVILKAGGFSDFADKHKVRLIHGGARNENATNTVIINIAEIWEKGKTGNDVPVEADDLVYVPKRSVNF